MAKFEVGQRVRCTGDFQGVAKLGDEGVAREVKNMREGFVVLVEFDKHNPEMHDGDGNIKMGRAWWLIDDELEVV